MAKNPTMQRAIGEVRRVFKEIDLSGRSGVVVACSGGADSLALAAAVLRAVGKGEGMGALGAGASMGALGEGASMGALGEGAGEPGARLGVAIIDHCLQPETEQVSENARQTCQNLGFDFVVVRKISVAKDSSLGLEAAARKQRYDALFEIMLEENADTLLTAHTKNDQAESVLLSLARGSGIKSLSGISAVKSVVDDGASAGGVGASVGGASAGCVGVANGGGAGGADGAVGDGGAGADGAGILLVRPFLRISRIETEEICRLEGIDYWVDPTNGTLGEENAELPLRSRVRNEVLPVIEKVLGKSAIDSLARSAELLKADSDMIDEMTCRAFKRCAGNSTRMCASSLADQRQTTLFLHIDELKKEPLQIQKRVIKLALEKVCDVQNHTLTKHQIDSVFNLIHNWKGQRPINLPRAAAYRSKKDKNLLVVEAKC